MCRSVSRLIARPRFVAPDGEDRSRHQPVGSQGKRGRYSWETYPQVLKGLAKVVDGTPEVDTYEVANSTFHKIAAHS
jgi:hypothetical protein